MNVVVELIKIEQRCSAIVSKILFKIQKKVSTANCQAERNVTCCLRHIIEWMTNDKILVTFSNDFLII